MEDVLIQGWDLIPPGCGEASSFSRAGAHPARWLYDPQPIRYRPRGVGSPHRAGQYRAGGSPFPSPGCWSRNLMGVFLIRRQERIVLGCGVVLTSAQGPIIAARWLYQPQPIGDQPNGVIFYTARGGIDRGHHRVSTPGGWNCRCILVFQIRAWQFILLRRRWL